MLREIQTVKETLRNLSKVIGIIFNFKINFNNWIAIYTFSYNYILITHYFNYKRKHLLRKTESTINIKHSTLISFVAFLFPFKI